MSLFDELFFISERECSICKYSEADKNGICYDCYDNLDIVNIEYYDSDIEVQIYYSLFYNNFLKGVVDRFKFRGQNYLFRSLGDIMSDTLKTLSLTNNYDLLVTVPMHRSSEKLRGYNQSELLARRISENTGIPFGNDLIYKVKETKQQHFLNTVERRKNLNNSFKTSKTSAIRGKRILIVDDIITTGETIRAIADTLRMHAPMQVDALALTSGRRID